MYDLLRDVIVHLLTKCYNCLHAIAVGMLISKILNLIPPDHLNFT